MLKTVLRKPNSFYFRKRKCLCCPFDHFECIFIKSSNLFPYFW